MINGIAKNTSFILGLCLQVAVLNAQTLPDSTLAIQDKKLEKWLEWESQQKYELIRGEIVEFYSQVNLVDTHSLAYTRVVALEGRVHSMLNHFKASIPCHKKAISRFKKYHEEVAQSEIMQCWDDLATDYRLNGEFAAAVSASDSLLIHCRKNIGSNSHEYAVYLVKASYPYIQFDLPEKGDSLVNKAIEIFYQCGSELHHDINLAYNIKGILNKNLGKYAESLKWYDRSLQVLEYNQAENGLEYTSILANVSNVLRRLNLLDSAISVLNRAMQINESIFGVDCLENDFVYSALSNCYMIKGAFAKGLDYGRKSLMLAEQMYGRESTFHVETDLAYRENLLMAGQPAKALSGHRNLGDRILRLYGPETETYNYYLLQVGKALKKQGDLEGSQKYLKKALQVLGLDSQKSIYDLVQVRYPESALFVFHELADLQYRLWKNSGDIKHLQVSFAHIENGMQVLDRFRRQSILKEDKRSFVASHQSLIHFGIDIIYKLYQITKADSLLNHALKYIESSKNILFTENLRTRDILQTTLIPAKEIKAARDQYNKILELENQLEMVSSDSSSILLTKELEKLVIEQQIWFEQIELKYPHFAQEHYGNWSKSIAELRDSFLQPQELILDYLIVDSIFYVLAISHHSASLRRGKTPSLALDTIIEGNNHASLANLPSIFQTLYGPELKSHQQIEMITVLPSKEITYVPFEALPINEDSLAIERYNYRQLISFSSSEKHFHRKQNRGILAAAPLYEKDSYPLSNWDESSSTTVHELPASQIEADQIIDVFGGRLLSSGPDIKDEFLTLAPSYRLLHLSMHTTVGSDESNDLSLIFDENDVEKGYLPLQQIYDLNLDADLVTLSACKTGVGEELSGEGIRSIAHAFAYAGASTMVMALWDVPDYSSAKIMTAFYHYVAKGVNKVEALRKAKIDFLQSAISGRQKHPKYWAGFVLVGDSEALLIEPKFDHWLMVLVVVLCAVIYLAFRYFRAWRLRA